MTVFRYFLPITCAVHLQNDVRQTHQCPFRFDLFDASQKELAKSTSLLDLSKYRFHDRLPRRIDRCTSLHLQLASHPINKSRARRQGTLFRFRLLPTVLLFLRGDISINAVSRNIFQILVRAVTAVGKQLIRLLSRLRLIRSTKVAVGGRGPSFGFSCFGPWFCFSVAI